MIVMLSADDIVAICTPALDRAESPEARRAALARLGGGVEAVDAQAGSVDRAHHQINPEDVPDIRDEKRWLTMGETARRGRVVYETVQDWVANGTVDAVRSGRTVYVDFTTVPIKRIIPKPPRTS